MLVHFFLRYYLFSRIVLVLLSRRVRVVNSLPFLFPWLHDFFHFLAYCVIYSSTCAIDVASTRDLNISFVSVVCVNLIPRALELIQVQICSNGSLKKIFFSGKIFITFRLLIVNIQHLAFIPHTLIFIHVDFIGIRDKVSGNWVVLLLGKILENVHLFLFWIPNQLHFYSLTWLNPNFASAASLG